MPLDGVLLHRIIEQMQDAVPMRINRITQPSSHEFVFHCFAKKKYALFISTHPVFSRIQFTNLKLSQSVELTHLLSLFRKYLDGGIIQTIHQVGYDRVFELTIDHRDDMGVIRTYRLVIELMGKYANLILVDEDDRVIDSQKRLGSFENSGRSIVPGSDYTVPTDFNRKPFNEIVHGFDYNESLTKQFDGISPLLENEILYRLKSQSIDSIVDEISNTTSLYIHGKDFHCIQLTHLNTPFEAFELMEGLDHYYHDLQEQERIKAHTGDLLKSVRRELKRSKQKLPHLYLDYENATESEHLRLYGDLLYAYYADAPSGKSEVILQDFEGNDVTIPLDQKRNGKDNAKRYFIRYRKAKTSLSYILEQIELTEDRIEYLESVLTQIEQASVEDAKEIQEELSNHGFRFKVQKSRQTKKSKKPNYIVIQYDEETVIYVGKNNIQNELITFKLARKEDMWFHAAHTHGAHVMIKSPSLNEDKIRLCAHLAAYYSKGRYGSSVEVHYTQAKYLKKVPGKPPGFVSMSTHNSIFIDPDAQLVHAFVAQ
ncbi:fibronectin-binding protein [Erysipelothrix larvae]|uniref:Fibronectin-binding protein n=1 Tax=Erysipelothrix larvae TaxID=1514105 RepID=A0A0X8GZT0_9FIRM|nr:NFACT RNA binding domain-containing protein [Erysipelothrix larvae]AMC93442.1 fibronectin-binding protein [Erysipelothrix larvae]